MSPRRWNHLAIALWLAIGIYLVGRVIEAVQAQPIPAPKAYSYVVPVKVREDLVAKTDNQTFEVKGSYLEVYRNGGLLREGADPNGDYVVTTVKGSKRLVLNPGYGPAPLAGEYVTLFYYK